MGIDCVKDMQFDVAYIHAEDPLNEEIRKRDNSNHNHIIKIEEEERSLFVLVVEHVFRLCTEKRQCSTGVNQ